MKETKPLREIRKENVSSEKMLFQMPNVAGRGTTCSYCWWHRWQLGRCLLLGMNLPLTGKLLRA